MNRGFYVITTAIAVAVLTAGVTAHASGVQTTGEEGSVTMPVIAGAIDHTDSSTGSSKPKDSGEGNSKPGDSGTGSSKPEPEVIVIYLPEKNPDSKKPTEGTSNAQTGKSDRGSTKDPVQRDQSSASKDASKLASKGSTAGASASGSASTGASRPSTSSSTGASTVSPDREIGSDSGNGSQGATGKKDENPEEIHTGTGAVEETGGRKTLPGFLIWLIPLLIILGLLTFLALTGRLTGPWMAVTCFLFRKRAFVWHGRLPVASARFVKVRKSEKASTEALQEIIDRTASVEELMEEALATGYETILPYNTGMAIACTDADGNRQVIRMKADENNLYEFLTDYEITKPVKVTIYNDPAEFECALVFSPKDEITDGSEDQTGDGYQRVIAQVKHDEEERAAAEESRELKEQQAQEQLQEFDEQRLEESEAEEDAHKEKTLRPELQKARLKALREKEEEERRIARHSRRRGRDEEPEPVEEIDADPDEEQPEDMGDEA